MDTSLAVAALVLAALALGVAIDARRRAGRGAGPAAPERAAPPPEFVKPAANAAPAPPRVPPAVDPLLVARLDALEAHIAAVASSLPGEPGATVSRRAAAKGEAAEAAPRSDAVRRVFP